MMHARGYVEIEQVKCYTKTNMMHAQRGMTGKELSLNLNL